MADLRDKPERADGTLIVSLDKIQGDGTPLVASQGRVGSEAIYATHNFCDPTTWYSDSTRITSASLTQSGSYWHHTGSQGYWTDLRHGKVFDEEGLMEDQQIFAGVNGTDAHGYSIQVVVSGVQKTERTPFATTGGDYTVDYISGTITPVSEDWSGLPVVASFSQKNTSTWIFEPLPNKVLVMEKAEVQFSADIIYTTGLVMEVYGYAAIFAPQYIQANGGPLPNDARVSIDYTVYKTIDQIIDEAINAFPQIPAMGGSARGFSQPRNVFQFHYGAVRKLYSSVGLQVRISLENDIAFEGERATATFYCTSQDDPGQLGALQEMGLI